MEKVHYPERKLRPRLEKWHPNLRRNRELLVPQKVVQLMSSHENPNLKNQANRSENTTDEEQGQYVEGEYGTAGAKEAHEATEPEGQYVEGDYGSAGTADAIDSDEAGSFTQADYGHAGEASGHTSTDSHGSYVESDLGE